MPKIILVEDNPSLKDLMLMELQELFPGETLVRENAEEALSYLSVLPKIEVLITASNSGPEDTASIIEEYISYNDLKTKLIVLGNFQSISSDTIIIPKRTDWKKATGEAIKLLWPDYDEDAIFLKKAAKWRKRPESSSL